jgi:O-antigen/teichoic acid export membrane protein
MPEVSNNRRIVKNTLMLYFRQMLIMLVNLYAVRVVLNTLGAEDYGIYTVVAGVITMFSSLSGSISSASQRYFAFEIGRNNYEQLKKTFSLCLTIYMLIGVLIVLLAETIGIWFVNHKLIIPDNRMNAARWIYQFALVSFLLTMITIPYMASIIAHEDMTIYAYVSIVEAILKLVIIFFLRLFSIDKLVIYGILICTVTFINTTIYRTICIKKYKECRFIFYWDYKLFKELTSYIGWNLLEQISTVLKNHGINILLNIFFGPIINSAKNIAMQVYSGVNTFAGHFTASMRPPIIKSYARDEYNKMFVLTFSNAKLSYLLLLILLIPIVFETPYILELWLKDVPDFTVIFIRLMSLDILIISISRALDVAIQATGKIKLAQILISSIFFFSLPVSYLMLILGMPSYSVMIVSLVLSVLVLIVRLFILKNSLNFSIVKFIAFVLFRIFIITIMVSVIPLFFVLYVDAGFMRLFLMIILNTVFVIVCIYFIGLTRDEQYIIKAFIHQFFRKLRKEQ